MKKLLVIALSIVMAASVCFAQAAPEAASGKTTIRVLNYIDMSEPNSANEITELWDKFNELHPEIEVIREDLFNEPFHQKVEAYAASGNLPDVMYMWPSGRSATLQTQGLVKDLQPMLEADGIFDDYNPSATGAQAAGYLAELPNGITATSMMFVNLKVLRENGLEIPKTYEDLKAMIPVLKAKGIEVIGMDNKDQWVMQSCLFSLIVGRFGGADWYNDLAAGKIKFTDDWFLKSLKLVDDIYSSGLINRNTLNIAYGSGRGDFAAGKAAFYIDGDWACASFQTDVSTGQALFNRDAQVTDIDMMNFPAIAGEVVKESNSVVVGTGWGMSADIADGSAEEAAAWELIKFLEGEYAQTWRLKTGAAFPSLLTVDVDKVIEENNLEPLVGKRAEWYNRIQVATPVIDGVLDPSVYNVINQVLAEIGLGSTTPEQGAKAVQEAWEAFNK